MFEAVGDTSVKGEEQRAVIHVDCGNVGFQVDRLLGVVQVVGVEVSQRGVFQHKQTLLFRDKLP